MVKKSAVFLVFLILSLAIYSGGVLANPACETRITTNIENQTNPNVYDDIIVWEDERDGNLDVDIYVYNMTSGREIGVVREFGDQFDPDVYGDNIVWTDYDSSSGDSVVYYRYDIDEGSDNRVDESSDDQERAVIYGNLILWVDVGGGDYDIFMNNTDTGVVDPFTLARNQYNPAIYEDKIVWEDFNSGGVYSLDLNNPTGLDTIAQGTGTPVYPDIYDDIIVWQDNSAGNWDVYYYDTDVVGGLPLSISSNIYDQVSPKVYEDIVVWADYRNNNWDIYMFNLITRVETRITSDAYDQVDPEIYGDIIVWEDQRAGNSDIYMFNLSCLSDPYTPVSPDVQDAIRESISLEGGSLAGLISGDEINDYHLEPDAFDIAYDDAGRMVIVASVKEATGDAHDIKYAYYDETGVLINEGTVNHCTEGDQITPSVDIKENVGFAVAWATDSDEIVLGTFDCRSHYEVERGGEDKGMDIAMAVFDYGSGGRMDLPTGDVGGERLVNNYFDRDILVDYEQGKGDDYDPSVAITDDRVIVAWTGDNKLDGRDGIYAKIYDVANNLQEVTPYWDTSCSGSVCNGATRNEFFLPGGSNGHHISPEIAAGNDSNGDDFFAVVWTKIFTSANKFYEYDVLMRTYTTQEGAPLVDQEDTYSGESDLYLSPYIDVGADGRIIVGWSQHAKHAIRGKLYSDYTLTTVEASEEVYDRPAKCAYLLDVDIAGKNSSQQLYSYASYNKAVGVDCGEFLGSDLSVDYYTSGVFIYNLTSNTEVMRANIVPYETFLTGIKGAGSFAGYAIAFQTYENEVAGVKLNESGSLMKMDGTVYGLVPCTIPCLGEYVCDTTQGQCYTSCTPTGNECSQGYSCVSGVCTVTQAPIACTVPCTPYTCDTTLGTCYPTCSGAATNCEIGYVCENGVCITPPQQQPQAGVYSEFCIDGLDNDGDGLVDSADHGCKVSLSSEYNRCGDGWDNDGDGLVDMYDAQCDHIGDDDESVDGIQDYYGNNVTLQQVQPAPALASGFGATRGLLDLKKIFSFIFGF